MTVGARTVLAAAILAAVAAGLLQIALIQRAGVMAGFALPVAAAVMAIVFRKPIAGLQLALLAVPLEFFSIKLGGDAGLSATEMLLLLTALAAVVRWALVGQAPRMHPALWALAALTLIVALSYTVAEDQLVVTKIFLMWSAFVVVGVLAASAEARELWRVLSCLAIAGGIAGFIAIAGGTDQELIGGGVVANNRAQASFAQPNVLAFFLAMAIPAAVVQAARGDVLQRALMTLMAVGAIWGLMLSLSRTGLVGTLLGLSVLLLWPPFRRVATVGLAVLVVFAMFNLGAIEESQQVSVVGQRLATLGRSDAVERDPRSRIWSETPEMVSDHPLLGVGAGNFSIASIPYGLLDPQRLPYDHAHNVPLTFAVETGLPGLLAFLWLMWATARLALRALARRDDPLLGPLGLAVTAALTGLVVTSLGDYPPRTNAIAATFIVLVGVLVALDRLGRAPQASVR